VERLPSNWIIDWRRFYDLATPEDAPGFRFNASRRIDPLLAKSLHELPGDPRPGAKKRNLAALNLKRGVRLGLPCGQDVARAMRMKPLKPAEIAQGPDGKAAAAHGLHEATPLWYYILKEAQVHHGGERLGPVGARIVAEVFVGLVAGDSSSYLSAERPWTPTLPSANAGDFTMADLLRFVDDVNPIEA
jgi:hypothetical protein